MSGLRRRETPSGTDTSYQQKGAELIMPSLVFNGNRIEARRESRRIILSRTGDDCSTAASVSVPLNDVDRATVVGHPHVSVSVLQKLMREGIPVSFISEKGHWYGTLHPDGDKNAARRLMQYRQQENPAVRLSCAKKVVRAKIRNQRRVLQRLAANRNESKASAHLDAVDTLRQLARTAGQAPDNESLRGIEGTAAARYFQRLGLFFPEAVPFNGRSRRPPRDAANALLSWTYTIVLSEVDAALRLQGLDPCFGWLHEVSAGTPALALDLLEPLRAPVCDLLVLNLLNHGILGPADFHVSAEDGGTYLNETARKKFFVHYESHMQRKFKPAPDAPHTDLRQCITRQVWGVLRLLENPETDEAGIFLMP
ncbi:CRISPR-associated endonuclease Cas1 [Verrucomicrobia bacterium S94]|nr:CRISPR-associated endonuclease Cas1 [Verrucomicrobia bacterium S94]